MINPGAVKSSKEELILKENFVKNVFNNCPIKNEDLLSNIALFLNRQTLSRVLFFDEIYKKFLNIHGNIMEFGLYYGRDLPVLQNLRGIYEPFNYTRRIIGFDTFEGLTELDEKDGKLATKGDFSVPGNYENYLRQILQYHEKESPLSQIKKTKIIKGNVCETLPKY